MKIQLTLGIIAAAAFSNAVVIIDDFDTGAYDEHISSGTAFSSQSGTMVGGDRYTQMTVTSNDFGLNIQTDIQNGTYSLSSQSLVDGFSKLSYGMQGANNAPTFDDMNLNLSGESAFAIDVLRNDFAANITVSVRSASQNGGAFMNFVAVAPATTSGSTVMVDFSNFAGFNFADLDQVMFTIDTPKSGDMTIGRAAAVPEPATMSILAVGAIAAIRRRKSRA